jgi:hypothetical protein
MEFALAIVGVLCAAIGGLFPLVLRWYTARSKRRIQAAQAQTADERIVP